MDVGEDHTTRKCTILQLGIHHKTSKCETYMKMYMKITPTDAERDYLTYILYYYIKICR